MSDDRFPKVKGSPPARLFLAIYRPSSFVREPSSTGIFPTNLFPVRSRAMRLEQLDILTGISPVTELLAIENIPSLLKLSFGGSLSLKLLLPNHSCVRKLVIS